MAQDQVFEQVVDGVRHRVVAGGNVRHEVTWTVDGDDVASKKELEDTVRLDGGDHGRLVVVYSAMGTPRRATLHEPGDELKSLGGVGGVDLEPAPGSKAAAYEQKVLDHPNRYAVLQTLGGVAKVVVPILLTLLVARFAIAIPWPDWNLPSIPMPDLPSIPWPSISLPSIPWPSWSLPGWLRETLSYLKYVWPVVLAFVLARAEIKRRRTQAEQRAASRSQRSAEPDADR